MQKLLLIFLIIQLMGFYKAHSKNLIPNGGFEEGLNSWWTDTSGGGDASFSIISDDVKEGNNSLKVDVVTPGTNPWDVQAVNNAWNSETGKSYTLKFWAKAATAESTFKAVLQIGDAYSEQVITLSDTWQEYEWTFNAQANGLQLKFHFPSSGTFFIDGIMIPEDVEMVELVKNGGFESGEGDSFTNWWFGTGSGTATFSEETSELKEGSRALKVEVSALGANPWDVQGINDAWSSIAGEEYTLTFWAKAANAGTTFKAVMQIGGSYSEKNFTLSENWEKYDWTFTAGENNLELKFQFTSVGTFLIDDVSIPVIVDEDVVTEELILNGSFENGTGNSFTNWWFGTGDGEAIITEETTEVQEGNRAVKVEVISLGSNPWEIQGINDAWSSKAGEDYTVSFWAKTSTAGMNIKAVQQIGASYSEQVFALTESWEKYEWNFTAGADNLEFKFQFLSEGTYYVDNVSIPSAVGPPQAGEGDIVLVEAENGTPVETSDPPVFMEMNEDGIEFIRVHEDFAATSNPGTETRVLTYSITFPAAGTYDLYARLRVGAEAFNDDSFYYGSGFGEKSATDENDWIMVNGLSPVGYNEPDQIVSEGGMAGNETWKWLRLSSFSGQGEAGVQFEVPEGNLTQTFQIGSRENGLDLDRFAFGTAGVLFTVDNLNKGESGTSTPPPPPFTPTGPPIAQGHPKFLGNIYSNSQLPHFTNYWNQVTPENAGKWGSVEGTRDIMNWTELDAAYALAKDNGYPFRFHVLVWGNQQPNWIETLSAEEQLEEIEEWFAAVANRYPDIDFIEVVNEPLHDPPLKANEGDAGSGNYYEALGGAGETGWDWVLNSFRLAKNHFPNTKLMINEYSITNNATDAQRYLDIINLLKAEDLIDIIGVQGHAFSTRVPAATTKENLDLLASAGLPIQVTELDIDGTDDQFQLEEYKRIFPVFWEHPAVMGITLWGWKPGMWRTAQGAFLALDNGAERPALVWLREYVENTKPAESTDGLVKFVLINAETDQELYDLKYGDVIDLKVLGTNEINIVVYNDSDKTRSVMFNLTGAKTIKRVENVAPYALFANDGDKYDSWVPALGQYHLAAVSFSEIGGKGEEMDSLYLSFTVINGQELPVVEKLTVYNAATDEELFQLVDGAVINLNDINAHMLNIRAYTDPELTGSVKFELSGTVDRTHIENVEPYALFKNDGDDFFSWHALTGNYHLTVTPYTFSGGKGDHGTPYEVSFTIENNDHSNHRKISAYPNPGNDHINILLQDNGGAEIIMVDLTGRQVIKEKVSESNGNNYVLDVSDLERNTYIIKVVSGKETRNFRWVKK